jgi:hypothetical protein
VEQKTEISASSKADDKNLCFSFFWETRISSPPHVGGCNLCYLLIAMETGTFAPSDAVDYDLCSWIRRLESSKSNKQKTTGIRASD